MPDGKTFPLGGRSYRFQTGRPAFAGFANLNYGQRASQLPGPQNRQLVIALSRQVEIVEAAGRREVLLNRHVGPSQRQVARYQELNPVIPHHEVADNAVGFLAAGQEVYIVLADLEDFDLPLPGREGVDRQHEKTTEQNQSWHGSSSSEIVENVVRRGRLSGERHGPAAGFLLKGRSLRLPIRVSRRPSKNCILWQGIITFPQWD